MQGIKLVAHAVKMLFRDIRTTVKLTVFPMLFGLVFVVLVAFLFSNDGLYAMLTGVKAPQYEQGAGDFLVYVSTVFILLTTMFWVAIGWHSLFFWKSIQAGFYRVSAKTLLTPIFGPL